MNWRPNTRIQESWRASSKMFGPPSVRRRASSRSAEPPHRIGVQVGDDAVAIDSAYHGTTSAGECASDAPRSGGIMRRPLPSHTEQEGEERVQNREPEIIGTLPTRLGEVDLKSDVEEQKQDPELGERVERRAYRRREKLVREEAVVASHADEQGTHDHRHPQAPETPPEEVRGRHEGRQREEKMTELGLGHGPAFGSRSRVPTTTSTTWSRPSSTNLTTGRSSASPSMLMRITPC